MKRFLLLVMMVFAATIIGCGDSGSGGSASPKPVGDQQLKPLPNPGSPADGMKPKGGAPGAGPGSQ